MAEPMFERIAAIFARETEIDADVLTRETGLRSFPQLDSLDLAEFFMEIEEEWGVELPDRVCCGFDTFGDVEDEVRRQVAARG